MELFSIAFLFYFLPLFLAIYYVTPEKEKSVVIIIGSTIFYLLQNGVNAGSVGLLLLLTGITYFLATQLQKSKQTIWLIVGILFLTEILLLFKCYHRLPVGMSFYLLQMVAYLIDTYRRRVSTKGIDTYAAQILLFPKLLSGPLVMPCQLQDQICKPKVSQTRFREGLQELVAGLGMKVLLADSLANLWNQAAVIGYDSISTLFAWLALVCFGLRLYFDFHGYSLIAVGLGKMLGLCLPPNFRTPYAARSVTDFFHRWHITLGTWFREYVYFPLGGNRKGWFRTVCNILLVWLLTAFWHGTSLNYFVWAGFLAFFIIQEKLWLGKLLQRIPIVAHIYTLLVIFLSWLPFALGEQGQLFTYLQRLFTLCGRVEWQQILPQIPILSAALFFATPIPNTVFEALREYFLFDFLLFVLFWVSIYFISTAQQNPFLYFQF